MPMRQGRPVGASVSCMIPSWRPLVTTLSKNCRLLSASGKRDNVFAQDGGRSSGWRASTLIADHFEKRPDSGLRAALGFHLAVDSALAVCLGFGLYALLHPSDVSSSYLVEYQALPAAVVAGDTPALPVAAAPPIAPEPRIRSISTAPATVMLQPEAMPEPELAPSLKWR